MSNQDKSLQLQPFILNLQREDKDNIIESKTSQDNICQEDQGILLDQTIKNEQISSHSASKIQILTPNQSRATNFLETTLQQNRFEGQIACLRQQNCQLKSQLNQFKKQMKDIQVKLEQSQQLNQSLSYLIEQNNTLSTALSKFEKIQQQLSCENNRLSSNLNEMSLINSRLEDRVKQLNRQNQQQRNQIGKVKQQKDVMLAMEKQSMRFKIIEQQFKNQKHQNQHLKSVLADNNIKMANLNTEYQNLQNLFDHLSQQKQQMKQTLQGLSCENRNEILSKMIDSQTDQLSELRQQLRFMEGKDFQRQQQFLNLHKQYQIEFHLNQQNEALIKNLNKEINHLKRTIKLQETSKKEIPFLDHKANKQQNTQSRSVNSNSRCSASPIKRAKILTNQETRKETMGQIKRILRDINNIGLENKLYALIQEIYMDAEYRERTNIQMKQIVIKLQEQVKQKRQHKQSKQDHINQGCAQHAESLHRYQLLLSQSDQQKLELISEINALKKQNYHLRLQLSNSQMDTQTEQLIEQLTLQLEQEKYRNSLFIQQNQRLKQEIFSIEKELNEKNKKIKLLTLNLNKKDGIIQTQSQSLIKN